MIHMYLQQKAAIFVKALIVFRLNIIFGLIYGKCILTQERVFAHS